MKETQGMKEGRRRKKDEEKKSREGRRWELM